MNEDIMPFHGKFSTGGFKVEIAVQANWPCNIILILALHL